ncbi:hypothetical protein E8E13_004496 [Curvularia kusanoi]|uniref:Uncharacterized protein n=1 Tax=Curvularia kusanoi TaxID=90978 RepID=A0A9P4T8H6_CURKU|nr:hypothetical protein E8E13_004496 [Curvularia kusanoi]
MAALLAVPPRTPSPEVRIRSQSFSFESPSSLTRLNATTPIEEYPFSKSTGNINTTKAVPQHHVLLPLRTKMSEESLSDTSSAMSISTASSPTTSSHRTSLQDLPEGNLLGLFTNAHAPMRADALTSHPPRPLSSQCGTQSPAKRARFSPPGLQLPPSVVVGAVDMGPASPFAFQDPSSAMTSPWLRQHSVLTTNEGSE